jgi:hypothetical protein
MRALSALVVITAALLGAPALRAHEACAADRDHVRVMLQDLETGPAFASRATGLGQVVAGEAALVKGYAVLSAEEVRAALNQEANKQMLGCSGQSCLAEIAEALDADLVVSGRVDAAPDGGALVSLTLLNARAVVVVNRVSMAWRGASSELPEVLRAAAQLLMMEPEQRPRGSLMVVGLPAGARVFVDGEDRTRDHVDGRIAGLEIGPHEVRAEAADMEPAIAHVVVKAGQQSAVTISLEPVSVPTLWLVLGGAGAVVLGGTVAVGIAYALGQSDVAVSAQVPSIGVNDAESVRKSGR